MDNKFEVWDIEKETCIIEVDLEKGIRHMDWNHGDTNLISFIMKQGNY